MSDFRGVLVRVRGGRASTIGGGMVDLEPGGSDGQRLGHPGWPQYFTGARTVSTRDEGDCDTPARTMPGCSRFCPANPGSTRGCANFRARCRPARAPGLAHGASDTGLRSDDVWVAVSWSTSLSRAFDLPGRHVDTSKLTGLEDEERPCSHQRCDGLLRQLTLAALTQPDRAPRPKRGPGHRCHVYLRVSRMEFTFLEPFSDVTHGIGRHTIYYANQCGKWSRGATRRSPLSWEVRSPCLRHRSHALCGTRNECRPHQHPLRESGGGDHPNAQTWYLCDLARSET